MIFNISMKMEHLLENEQATAVFDKMLPGMLKMVGSDSQATKLSVEQLIRYSRVPEGEKILAAMDTALQALNTPENAISPSEAKQIELFKRLDHQDKEKSTEGKAAPCAKCHLPRPALAGYQGGAHPGPRRSGLL